MSYCRFGWEGSEVYVYEAEDGLTCCGCHLIEDGFVCEEPEEMIAHLVAHRRAGHFVPEHAVTGLWAVVPGAQRPARGQRKVFTEANLQMTIIRLQGELARLNAK